MSLEQIRALVGKAAEKIDHKGVEASRKVKKGEVVAVTKIEEAMATDEELLKLGR